MISRRTFFKSIGFFLGSLGLPLAASAGSKSIPPAANPKPRFIKRVREVTRKMNITKDRWQMMICHHSAIRTGNAAIYDRAHRKRGMENGLAYHFLIGNGVDSGDGEIEIGSRWLKQIKGGHVRSDEINEVAIGICLIGNFDETRPTKNQLIAFRELMDFLRAEVVRPKVRLSCHREVDPAHTRCPGRYFPMKEMHRLYG